MTKRSWWTHGVIAVGTMLTATLPAGPAGAVTDASPGASAELNRGQAVALAKAGVARAGDVPGFSAEVASLDARQKSLAVYRSDEAAFYNCVGFTQPTYLARAFGPKFKAERNQAELVTTADVTPSAEAARNTMAVHHGEQGSRCYQQRLANALRRLGLTGDVVVREVAFSVPGADETYAYRSTITTRGPKGAAKAEALLVGSRVGPVLTTVSYSLGRGLQIAGKTIQKTAAVPVARVRKELSREAGRARS